KFFSSVQMIPVSFFAAIVTGALILMLPIASASGRWTPFVDALFTSATSICVTGLTVVDTGNYWSLFGQAVILVMIQIGGLGIIAVLSVIMVVAQKKFTLRDRIMLKDSLNLDTTSGVVKFLLRIIRATFIVEFSGTVLYSVDFIPRYGFWKGLRLSLFNAISAFCNAGMDILGENSLESFNDNAYVMVVTMMLIILGGGGFIVWFDVLKQTGEGIKKRFSVRQIFTRFSEHTKLVLSLTLFLLLFGTVIVFAAEYNNPETLGNMTLGYKILNSLFESVTYRTAGFCTFSQAGLTGFTCIFAYLIMFIGGSPIGTAGGVKTTTFYLAVKNITSFLRGEENARVFKRAVPAEQMRKAGVIVSVSFVTAVFLTLLLVASNPISMQDGLFEIVSASATVGLTRDITPSLNTAGKLIVTFAMYLGRIAPISMAIFLAGGNRSKKTINNPDGRFFIG
ncbi:MAG: potassium transporter TrkH, partial [Lachnospiraceae bacterium]|nr:potassium transporter TrkH [Lachnospiraceae bacterium]